MTPNKSINSGQQSVQRAVFRLTVASGAVLHFDGNDFATRHLHQRRQEAMYMIEIGQSQKLIPPKQLQTAARVGVLSRRIAARIVLANFEEKRRQPVSCRW